MHASVWLEWGIHFNVGASWEMWLKEARSWRAFCGLLGDWITKKKKTLKFLKRWVIWSKLLIRKIGICKCMGGEPVTPRYWIGDKGTGWRISKKEYSTWLHYSRFGICVGMPFTKTENTRVKVDGTMQTFWIWDLYHRSTLGR